MTNDHVFQYNGSQINCNLDEDLRPNYSTLGNQAIHESCKVTKLDIGCIILSIVTHVISLVFSLTLAGRYLFFGHLKYFIWTILFLFIPSFINVVMSNRIYRQDVEMEPDFLENPTLSCRIIKKKKYWPCIVFFQLASILRYVDNLRYARSSYRCQKHGDEQGQKKYYAMFIKGKQDITLLQVFQCYLEAAPHQVFQLCLVIIDYNVNSTIDNNIIHRIICLLVSLTSMSWAMASYHGTLRLVQKEKATIGSIGTTLQFFWHFFITVSRIVAIGTVAAIYSIPTIIVCCVHWIIMTLWIVNKPSEVTRFCHDQSKPPHVPPTFYEYMGSYVLCAIYGIVSIFIYLKPVDGPTFHRYCFFYTVCALENACVCLMWIIGENSSIRCFRHWRYIIVSICAFPFILGIFLIIIYYYFFHPNIKNRIAKT